MPLDVTVSPKHVTATLHYLVRGAEKPVRYVDEPPPGANAYNGIDDPHEVRIEDARGREAEFTLDRNSCHVRFQGARTPNSTRFFFRLNVSDAGMHGGGRALSDG